MMRSGYIPYSLGMLTENLKQDFRYASEELFSFYLGPAFNAPGRLNDKGAMEMLKYLMSPTPEGAEKIVGINNMRKEIRDSEYDLVKAAIYAQGQTEVDPIWVYVPNLHEGIVGILAGKVVEDYGVSAIVLTDSAEPGVYKGSARGAVGFSIFNHLLECGDVFERMGGHDGAAGLSIKAENLKKAMSHQNARSHDPKAETSFIEIEKEEIPNISKVVERFQPFGEGNPAPEFGVAIDMNADNVRMVGKNSEHLILQNDQEGYKITHFFHDPNSLSNKSKFELRGQVKKTAFANKEVPTFDARDAVDIYDDREWGCK